MGTRALLAFLITMCAVSGVIQAYSAQSIGSLMTQYGVPGSVTSGLSPINLTYAGGSYVALYDGTALYFLINVTNANAYTFVLNSTTAYDVIQSHEAGVALENANFGALSSQMSAFQSSSTSAIDDCLLETGLSTGDTCTLNNTCYSCQIVPVCRKVLTATGGANESFGLGVMQFASQYAQLNASFNAFYAAASGVNSSDAQSRLSQLNSAFDNISSISRVIFENSIFPPTANITADVVANCAYYQSSASSPWYCTAVGFCGNLDYNYTKLDYIQGLLNGIDALPISSAEIQQVADNASANANRYVMPLVSQQQQARLVQLLNETLPGYGQLVSNAGSLLTHVSNSSLSFDLATITANYDNVTANYETTNFTVANRTLSAQYAALEKVYAKVNATYSVLMGRVQNNTAKLLELQVNGAISPAVANLAFEQFALNGQAFSGALGGNLGTLSAQANAIAQRLSSYSIGSISLVELARSVDGPFIVVAASSMGLGYSDAVNLAPLLGALLSLIIGAVLFALVLLYRARMHRHHKVVLNHRTRRNWTIVLCFLLVLVLLYVLATYVLLSYASSSAPFGAFAAALGPSKQVAIAINGTSTPDVQACVGAITSALGASNRTTTIVTFNGGLCNMNGITGSVDSCMSAFAGTGVPVVVLTESATQSMAAYSLYGTKLLVSGPAQSMDSCYVQYLLR